ncbi:MAG: hypothetical protein ABW007_20015 [Chitinophagaceae bacterium]
MKHQSLIIAALALALTVHNTDVHAQNKQTEVQSVYSYNGKTTINATEDGQKFEIEMEGKKIVQLHVDGKKIREEDFSKYESTIKKIEERIEKERAKAEKARAEAAIHREEAEKHRAEAEVHRKEASAAREAAEKDRNRAAVQRQEAETQRRQAEQHRTHAERQREEAQAQRAVADRHRAEAEVHRNEAEKHRAEAEVHRAAAAEERRKFDTMIDELVTDKLIPSRKELRSVVFDNNELLINDVKQPDAVYKKYKEKYLKNTTGRITFRNDDGSRTISLD